MHNYTSLPRVRIWRLASIILIGVLLISCASPTAVSTTAVPSPLVVSATEPQTTPTIEPTPVPTNIPQAIPYPGIGVETNKINPLILGKTGNVHVNMMRVNGLLWSKVEPEEGQRNWEAVASLETELKSIAEIGVQVILIVRSTPPWAQKVPGATCGVVKADKLTAYATFLKDLAARYSVPPFSVKYWELGNEPDVDPSLIPPDSPFGCYGDQNDPYYGGGYYAEMLKAAYPAIKASDPEAQVSIGGLLLDCDPTNPPQGKDCKPSLFLKGILENGGGPFFDIVSYHSYTLYVGSLDWDENHPAWKSRGGVSAGKVSFIREVLSSYGLQKAIFDTEAGLVCSEKSKDWCNPPGDNFYEAQADYLVRLYVGNWANDVKATIWYTLDGPGWRYGSLLDKDQNPKPAYRAARFLQKELGESTYTGSINQYPGLRVYEFAAKGKRIWVLWAPNEIEQTIQLPGGNPHVFDKYGAEIPLSGNMLPVKNPIYIEFAP